MSSVRIICLIDSDIDACVGPSDGIDNKTPQICIFMQVVLKKFFLAKIFYNFSRCFFENPKRLIYL